MTVKPVFKGSTKDHFLAEVREKVDDYFVKSDLSKTATLLLHTKGFFLALSLVILWSCLMKGWLPFIPPLFFWMLLGVNQGLLAMNVGHDALHGSYSSSPRLNQLLGYLSYDLVGLSSWVWKKTHNQEHHTFTNIAGHDPDINKPTLLRLSPHGPLYPIHRYQHYYIWFLYALVGLNWVLYADYADVWKEKNKISRSELALFFLFKGINLTLLIILPLLYSPMGWKEIALGYFLMQCAGGFTVSIIFQLAHIVEDVAFPLPNQEGVIPECWGVHEMETTANFARKSPFVTHLFGGLNFQIEHHLMPKISHAHYSKISSIVQETAAKYKLPYHEQHSLFSAIASHYRTLKKFGWEAFFKPNLRP